MPRKTRREARGGTQSVEAKRALYAQIDRLHTLGIPKGHVTTIVHDVPTASWGLSTGVAAADVDLGFEVTV